MKLQRILLALSALALRLVRPYAAHAYRARGDGDNRVRFAFACDPRALRIGDQLVCGDYVLAAPEQGYNGSVRIKLTGGLNGHWIEVPSRIPIAIWPNNKMRNAPSSEP